MKRLDVFDTAQLAVEMTLLEEDALMEDISRSASFRDSFTEVRARLQRQLAAGVAGAESGSVSGSFAARMKLPKLELPKFDGDVLQWETFWQSFQCAVGQSTELSLVQKLTYLGYSNDPGLRFY